MQDLKSETEIQLSAVIREMSIQLVDIQLTSADREARAQIRSNELLQSISRLHSGLDQAINAFEARQNRNLLSVELHLKQNEKASKRRHRQCEKAAQRRHLQSERSASRRHTELISAITGRHTELISAITGLTQTISQGKFLLC